MGKRQRRNSRQQKKTANHGPIPRHGDEAGAAKPPIEVKNDKALAIRRKTANTLLSLVEGADLFRDNHRTLYISIDVNGHVETWKLRSKDFEDWLCHRAYEVTGDIPNQQAIEDAIKTLSGRARFSGPTRDVYLRIAGHEDRI